MKGANRAWYLRGTSGLILFTLALWLTACAAQATPQTLENKEWSLVSYEPLDSETPLVAGSSITLSFISGKIGGSGGCNSYGGEYQIKGNKISFSNINSTLMACADEKVNQQEQKYLQGLQAVSSFEITNNHLYLNDSTGKRLFNYQLNTTTTPAALTPYP